MKMMRLLTVVATTVLVVACGSGADPASFFTSDNSTFTLSVNRDGDGSGIVTSSPGGVDCGDICSLAVEAGTSVTLTATPDAGFQFAGWGGAAAADCSDSGPCAISVTANSAVTATFSRAGLAQYSLNLTVSGPGTVNSDSGGINCSSDCAAAFAAGTAVTLTATPASGYKLAKWAGNGISCSGSTCRVPMNSARSVTATFTALAPATYALGVSVSPAGSGSVGSLPAGILCGSDCTESYNSDTVVALGATPANGYQFSGWSGVACTGTGNCLVTMSAARMVTAVFSAIPLNTYALNVVVSGFGTVTSTPSGLDCPTTCSKTFSQGANVSLTAVPAAGYRFAGWAPTGVCSGTGGCAVTMTTATTVGATFVQITYPLTVSKQGTGAGTVTSSPSGIACGATCSSNYGAGAGVVLTANPASGSTFGGWSGACTGTAANCTVALNGPVSVSATFTAMPKYLLTATTSGSGSVSSAAAGIACGVACTSSLSVGSSVTLTATPASGYQVSGWTGDCSGIGTACTVVMSVARKVGITFAAIPASAPPVSSSGLGLTACVAGSGKDYQVGPGSGQLASLDLVPWESLAAGDTVRVFYKSTPYAGKFLIMAHGTAAAPVRVCGVKGPAGERPVISGDGAVTRRGLVYGSSSNAAIQESRSIIMIKANQTWTDYPSNIQIDGLALRSAHPNYKFTDSNGAVQSYTDFGACLWIDRGQNITIADNEISDCTSGLFSKSSDDGDFAVTKNIRVAGNYIHGNGMVGDDHEHNSYMQSVGIVYEFNHYGPPRSGSLGIGLKDRSVGAVIRFNRIEEGSRAIDLVEAEDYPVTAMANPAYRTTFVYGNQIVKSGDTGSFIHYGGDHYGSTPGAMWGEPIFRKGTLYFFNNTIYAKGSGAALFQLATTEEKAEVWNNIFVFASSVTYPTMRSTTEIGASWTAGGIVNLGRNWVNANWADSDPWHVVPGQLNGKANLITGSTAPIDLTTLVPLAGSAVVDATQAAPAAASSFVLNLQLNSSFNPVLRSINGAAADLGALER